MDRRSDHPTHVVARRRINRQCYVWNAEHGPKWHAELHWPLAWSTTTRPSILVTFADEPGVGWYSRCVLNDALLNHVADSVEIAAMNTVQVILMEMQGDVGRLRSGARPQPDNTSSAGLSIERAALFPEPDHAPELAAQNAYEAVRSDPWLGTDDEPVTAHRVAGVEVHTGPRKFCTWPSHQTWAIEKFGRSRDDQHT